MVRKGDIACYKQFLLLSQCFPQLYILNASKCAALCGNGLNGKCVHWFLKKHDFNVFKQSVKSHSRHVILAT